MYLAVRGKVFDVTPGRNFYGPGGPYENFAGRDASRGLACGSFDEDMLTKDLDGPLDDLSGLGQEEMQAMRDWEDRFTGTSICILVCHEAVSQTQCCVLIHYLGVPFPRQCFHDLTSGLAYFVLTTTCSLDKYLVVGKLVPVSEAPEEGPQI